MCGAALSVYVNIHTLLVTPLPSNESSIIVSHSSAPPLQHTAAMDTAQAAHHCDPAAAASSALVALATILRVQQTKLENMDDQKL